jgi:hypothetical protein
VSDAHSRVVSITHAEFKSKPMTAAKAMRATDSVVASFPVLVIGVVAGILFDLCVPKT